MAYIQRITESFDYEGELTSNGWTGDNILEARDGYCSPRDLITSSLHTTYCTIPSADRSLHTKLVYDVDISKTEAWNDGGVLTVGVQLGWVTDAGIRATIETDWNDANQGWYLYTRLSGEAGNTKHYLHPTGIFQQSGAYDFLFTGQEHWHMVFTFSGANVTMEWKGTTWAFTLYGSTSQKFGSVRLDEDISTSNKSPAKRWGPGNSYRINYISAATGTAVADADRPRDRVVLKLILDDAGEKFYSDADISTGLLDADGLVNSFGYMQKTLNPKRGLFTISQMHLAMDNVHLDMSKVVYNERHNSHDLLNRKAIIYLMNPEDDFSLWKQLYEGVVDSYNIQGTIFNLTLSDYFMTDIASKGVSLGIMKDTTSLPTDGTRALSEFDSRFFGVKKRYCYGYMSVEDAYATGQPNGLCEMKKAGIEERGWYLNHGGESGGSFAVNDSIVGGTSKAEGTVVERTASYVRIKPKDGNYTEGETISNGAGVTATLNSGAVAAPAQEKAQDYYFYYAAQGVCVITKKTTGAYDIYSNEYSVTRLASAAPPGLGLSVYTMKPSTERFYMIKVNPEIVNPGSRSCSSDLQGEWLDSVKTSFSWKSINPAYILLDILEYRYNIPLSRLDVGSFEHVGEICKWAGQWNPSTSAYVYPGFRCAMFIEDGDVLADVVNSICQAFLIDIYVKKNGRIAIAIESESSSYDITDDQIIVLSSQAKPEYLVTRIYAKCYNRHGSGRYFKLQNTDDDIYQVKAAAVQLVAGRDYDLNFDAKYHCDYDQSRNGSATGGGLDSMEIAVYNYLRCFGGVQDYIDVEMRFDLDNIDDIELKKCHTLTHHTGYDTDGDMDELAVEVSSLYFDLDRFIVKIQYRPRFIPKYNIP